MQVRTKGLGVRGKLMALLVGVSVLSLLIACAAFVYYDRVSYSEAKRGTLSVLVDSVSQSAYGPTAFQDVDSAAVILKVLESEPSAQVGAIYTTEGAQLARWDRKGSKVKLPAQLDQLDQLDQKSGFFGRELRLTRDVSTGAQKVGVLHVVFSTDDIRARTRRFLEIAFGVLFVSALLALGLATLGQRVLTRPVDLLGSAARRVQHERDFNVRAERVSNDELGQLTDAFNAMLDMIQTRDRELENHRASLEETVKERTRDLDRRNGEMRLVLDNVDQGLVMIDRAAVPFGERSAIFDRWFGAPEPGSRFGALIGHSVSGFDVQFTMQWEQLIDGFLPVELNLAQMPARMVTQSGRHYQLAYRPVGANAEQFEKLLVVISDITEHVEKAKVEAQQSQLIALLEHSSADREGFLNFFRETHATIERLTSPEPRDRTLVMRELHTLKGNCGLFGLKLLAALIHAIEDDCIEHESLPSAEDRQELRETWAQLADRARTFLGENSRAQNVDRGALERLVAAIRSQRPHPELDRLAGRLTLEPVAPKLAMMAERARMLADRLGKGPVVVEVQAEGVAASGELGWLWQVLPHVVANSVDHGLDAADERVARGKASPGKLRLAAIERPTGIVVEIEDDGRGIDWEKVRARARKLGIPATTHEDLERALFLDGVSTRDQATEVSGRGIGLAAVEAACTEHGASIRVVSEPGKGTLFRVTVANDNDARAKHDAA